MPNDRCEKWAVQPGALAQTDAPGSEHSTEVPLRTVAAVLCGLAAAWIAAGSTGLLGHPLRRLLVLVALLAALLVHGPRRLRGVPLLSLAAALGLSAWMVSSPLPPVNIGAAIILLAYLAVGSAGQTRSVLLVSSVAAAVLMFYRAVVTSIPSLWLAADSVAGALGGLAGLITRHRLHVGATFAGLDFLVLTGTLGGLWLAHTPRPRRTRALYAFLAILGVHLCYLAILSYVPSLLAVLPKPGTGEQRWWMAVVHKAVPWNVPVLACGMHLVVIAALLRWSVWIEAAEPAGLPKPRTLFRRYALPAAVLLLAGVLPVVTSLYPGKPNLQGKKIVMYEKGFLNWLKPEHGSYGRLSGGMYGMLPIFLEALGAKPLISSNLSDEDLRGADLLALIFPNEPWADGQLERIWAYVRGGGSLLVLGEHTTREGDGKNRFNEVLGPTDIEVAFDSATFAVGGWLQSYEAITHPATVGVPDDRNQFGVVIGASLETRWPARPVLMGRWGWADLGDDAASQRAMMGNDRLDPGEKLGDLVLAAEQRLGRGRVLVFGDTSGFTNGINVGSHVFTSRVFAYLAGHSPWTHPWWRELAGVLLGAVLVGLATRRTTAFLAPVAVLVFAGALTVCTSITSRAADVLPDGRHRTPGNLAYIDASHLEAYSGESWRPEAIGGLALTLMRDGYVTLSLREVSARRLEGAALLVSIAPSREFSQSELVVVRDFIARGGIFIIMAGYDSPSASHALLSEFGFAIGTSDAGAGEPEPMGHFKSPYLKSEDRQVYVRFHAGWPVTCKDPQAQVIAYGRDNVPIILVRRVDAGKVAVIGDACFASDQNLESEDGQPVEGLRENADFWRWFIGHLRGGPPWLPPPLRSAEEAQTTPQERMEWKGSLSPLLQSAPQTPSEGVIPSQPAQEVNP